jgi:hypothetical protein
VARAGVAQRAICIVHHRTIMSNMVSDAVSTDVRPPWYQRPEFAGALLVGLLAMLVSLARTLHEPSWPTDLDQWYYAAQAMLRGGNPYEAVGPDKQFKWDWSLHYPISTVVLTMPLTALSVQAARVVFSTAGGAVLGYALGKDQFRRVGVVLSAAFLIAVSRNQWSLFITAAYFTPLAVLFLAAKPNMAVPFVLGVRSWRALAWLVGLGTLAAVVTLIARPSGLSEWLRILDRMQYIVSPAMRPFGWLYALALLKWRRPDARIFLGLVLVPQTPSLYDLLPLFLITRTVREVSLLTLLTHALFFGIVVLGPFSDFNRYAYELGNLSTFVIYLPVLVMLLRRPNVYHDDVPQAAPLSWRARLEALPRADVALVLLNVFAAAMLVWVSMATHRT